MLLFELLDYLLVDGLFLLLAEIGVVALLECDLLFVALLFDDEEIVLFAALFLGVQFLQHVLCDSLLDVLRGLELL